MTDQKERCVIISASPVFDNKEISKSDYVIICDGGYSHACINGIKGDVLIGDFDSFQGKIPNEIEIVFSKPEKDDTDTMLAVRYGLNRGFLNFLILGGTGGRIDHQMANISTLAFIAEKGGIGELSDKKNRIRIIKNRSINIKKRPGWSLSVFSFSDESKGVQLSGVKYPLKDSTLTNCFPLGVSNEIVDESAHVEVNNGVLLIIESLI